MPGENNLIVLYIDDETVHAEAFKEHWAHILAAVYPRVDISLTSSYDENQLANRRPHLVIVDNVQSNSTFDEKENMGAFFISSVKERYRDTVFILFTGQTFSIKTLGSVYPNPDLIIPKTSIKGSKYQSEFLVPTIRRLLKRLPIGDITFPDLADKNAARAFMSEIRAILEQCTLFLVNFESDPIDEIRLKSLKGGKSDAQVFMASIAGLIRLQNVPCVFRFGKTKDIQEEVRNYNLFARLQMPHNLRVELLGSGAAGEWGGALYAFALGDPAETTTVTSVLASASLPDAMTLIASITDELFGSRKTGWYNVLSETREKVDVFFANSEEYAPEKDTIRLARIQSSYQKHIKSGGFKIDSDGINFNGKKIDVPRTFAGKFAGGFIQKTICHGDLNTNNIIISTDRRRMALIDFEYTGIDHIFKDFVSLEISVRAYFSGASSEDIDVIIADESVSLKAFLDPLAATHSASDLVSAIRGKCLDRFASVWSQSMAYQYVLCLSFHLQKVAAIPGWNSAQFGRLIAAFIATAQVLSDVEDVPS